MTNMNLNNDVPPNPFVTNAELPQIPTIPGFDVAPRKQSPIGLHGVLLVLVIAIAGGALWGMRMIGFAGAKTIPSENSVIDVDSFSAVGKDHLKVVADLNAQRSDRQVGNDELKKNPFELSDAAKPKKHEQNPVLPIDDDPTGEKAAAAKRAGDIAEEFKMFQLQSVMGGTSPLARINGQVYRIGDKVGEFFTVMDVEGRTVTLTADGKTYPMSMDK